MVDLSSLYNIVREILLGAGVEKFSMCVSADMKKKLQLNNISCKYLESFSSGSHFATINDLLKKEEMIPLKEIYSNLKISEHTGRKEDIEPCGYHDSEKRTNAVNIDPEELMKEKNGIICILGSPGSGKTTLSKYLSMETSEGKFDKHRFLIYVDLKGFQAKEFHPIKYSLEQNLSNRFTPEEIGDFAIYIRNNIDFLSPVFIFDGWDEVTENRSEISKRISSISDQSLCIVTSRYTGSYGLAQNKIYEIQPLQKEERKKFVQNYFEYRGREDRIDPFLDILRMPGYSTISSNPLLLSFLCSLAVDLRKIEDLPSKRIELYKMIVKKMNEWSRGRGKKFLTTQQLEELEDFAFRLLCEEKPRERFDEKDIRNDELLETTQEVGLIDRWNDIQYCFLHTTLQEFLAACALERKTDWIEIVKEKKNLVTWYETLQFFAGILDNNGRYEDLRDFFSAICEDSDILLLNYVLCGLCLREVDVSKIPNEAQVIEEALVENLRDGGCPAFFSYSIICSGQKKIVERIIKELKKTEDNLTLRRLVAVLGIMGDPKAVDPLLDVFERTEDFIMRISIVQQLERIGDSGLQALLDLLNRTNDGFVQFTIAFALSMVVRYPKAVDPLIKLLRETDDNSVREVTAQALGGMGNPKAVDPLIDVLEKTDDNSARKKIVWALGVIGDSKAVDPLKKLSSGIDNNSLQKEIVFAFCDIGHPRTIEYIMDFLEKTEDTNLKWRIGEKLGKMGDAIIHPLIDHLKETDCKFVQQSIVLALGMIGDSAIQPLIDLLKETDKEQVHWNIAEALGMIGDSAIQPLIDLLKETDKELAQRTITDALSRIGGSLVVDLLIEILKNTRSISKQKSIISALGTVGNPKAVDPLIDGLGLDETKYSSVQMVIVWALGRIRDPTAVEPLVKFLERTEDNSIQAEIAEALGEIKDKKALAPLLNRLDKTKNSLVQLKIAGALGKIGDPKAVDPLLNLLEMKDINLVDERHLQASIGKALIEIGDSRAIDPLAHLIESGDEHVKYTIAQALSKTENAEAFKNLMYPYLESKDGSIRERIVWKLAEIKDPIAVKPLMNLLFESKNIPQQKKIADALNRIGDIAVQSLINQLERTQDNSEQKKIFFVLGEIGDPKAVDPLLCFLGKIDDSSILVDIVNALGKIRDPKVVGPLTDPLKEIQENSLHSSVINTLKRFSPYYFYECSCLEENAVFPVLCHFSIDYGLRFFKDRIVLPTGKIQYVQKEQEKEETKMELDIFLKSEGFYN